MTTSDRQLTIPFDFGFSAVSRLPPSQGYDTRLPPSQCYDTRPSHSANPILDFGLVFHFVLQPYSSANLFTGRAGTPQTTMFGATSCATTDPAPTTLPLPIVTPGRMVTRAPIQQPS